MVKFHIDWNKKENKRMFEGKSLVFHCHHYNCYLQRTLEDAKMVDGKGIQINTARDVAFEHFTRVFRDHLELKNPRQKFAFASKFFQLTGFGLIDFSKVNSEGGTVKCPVSHYAKGWLAKWGKRKTPMCYFNVGWIAGVIAAVYCKERFSYEVKETRCEAVRGKGCTFEVEVI